MYASWQQYINDFKQLANLRQSALRLSLFEEELDEHWDSCSLAAMESMTLLASPIAVNFLYSQILPSYLAARKVHQEAYSVNLPDEKGQEQSLLYVYDCRLFRGGTFSKEENDFISSFMLVYREDFPVSDRVFEVVDPLNIPPGQWVLKVKESGLLRVHSFMRETLGRLRHRQDKVVLEEDQYQPFMQEWLKCYCNYNLEVALGYFFRGVLVLLQNQLLRAYTATLSPQQLSDRIFRRPIRVIDKPKNVEQFTLTEGRAQTETQWQSLKITAFKLKYRIEEGPLRYLCFLSPEQPEQPEAQYGEEDRKIVEALAEERRKYEAYLQLFS